MKRTAVIPAWLSRPWCPNLCHTGVGLAGIQKSFNKLDAGLHRHDKQWSQTGMGLAGIQKSFNKLDAGLHRHDEHCGHSGVGLAGIQA